MNSFSTITRTTAFRLSALYLLLFLVGSVAIVFYMTNLSASLLYGQTQQALSEEVTSIGKSYSRGGVRALIRSIDYRSRQPGAYLYLLTDHTGRVLAGNIEATEPGVLDNDEFTSEPFTYKRIDEQQEIVEHKAIAVIISLPNGMRLMVGRDLDEPEHFRSVIKRSLTIALGIMGIGALLIWLFVGRRALKRINGLTIASNRIMQGDLNGRLPVNGSGDEFDRLALNLNAMLRRIQELNDGMKAVSDNIAHDLKTPLTRLRNQADEALTGARSEEEFKNALLSIIDESDQLIRTFSAILMISRLEAGYSAENFELLPVAPILQDVVEMYEPVAEDGGGELKLGHLDETLLRINRELVGQVVSNLIDNAIKYAANDDDAIKISVSMIKTDSDLEVIIEDNGAGIPEDARERVTERFVRLEKSRSQPGSGLGLSLAKAVMKLHGGKILLQDNPAGNGLRVVLAFPIPTS